MDANDPKSKTAKTVKHIHNRRIIRLVYCLFDNPSNYDIIFQFPDGKQILELKSFLIETNQYLRIMVSERWCQTNLIRIRTYAYNTFYHYLKFLHTGMLDMKKVERLEELLDLAKCSSEDGILMLCDHHMEQNLNTDNRVRYKRLAQTYGLKNVIKAECCNEKPQPVAAGAAAAASADKKPKTEEHEWLGQFGPKDWLEFFHPNSCPTNKNHRIKKR